MKTRNIVVVLFALLAGFYLYQLSQTNAGSDRTGNETSQMVISTDYADLVSLFTEFRTFQQSESNDNVSYTKSGWTVSTDDVVPDFSAAAMAEKFGELRTVQKRLESIDSTGWAIAQRVDYHLVRAEMNGYEFQHRVLSPWSRDPGVLQ